MIKIKGKNLFVRKMHQQKFHHFLLLDFYEGKAHVQNDTHYKKLGFFQRSKSSQIPLIIAAIDHFQRFLIRCMFDEIKVPFLINFSDS